MEEQGVYSTDAKYWVQQPNGWQRRYGNNTETEGSYCIETTDDSESRNTLIQYFDGLVYPDSITEVSWYDTDDSYYSISYRVDLILEDDTTYLIMGTSGDHTPWAGKHVYGPFPSITKMVKGIRFKVTYIQSGMLYIDDVSVMGLSEKNLTQMMIGDLTILNENIINFEAEEASNIGVPNWLSQSPDFNVIGNPSMERNVWSKEHEALNYTLRVTNAQLSSLRTSKAGHILLALVDLTYNKTGNVWIEDIQSQYAAEEDNVYPWKIQLKVILV